MGRSDVDNWDQSSHIMRRWKAKFRAAERERGDVRGLFVVEGILCYGPMDEERWCPSRSDPVPERKE